ncbi:MAG: fasciclin domain-containing protein [Alphaproteobacteria bacterium]|nr:fasciclin domain-containing protein [Alphaproteobacteria bacterium]
MKRAAIAGFAAGVAMAIGGALGAVSGLSDSRPVLEPEVSNPMIGGQAMLPDHDLMANISASPEHAKLAAALRDSGIASALKSNGLFTLFAPVDAAFNVEGTAGNKAQLAHRIGYLVVPGRYDSQALLRQINEGGGEVKMRTVDGGVLTARMNGPTNIILMDERGRTADIAIYDVRSKNGVIMVIDHMAAPSGPSKQLAMNN